MLLINLKSRMRNKAFLIAMISAIVLLIQQLGFKDLIPTNYTDIEYSILTILTMLGIIVDPSTSGLSDTIASSATVQAINQSEETKVEATTTSINNEVTEKSQDSNAINSTATPTEPIISAEDLATLQENNSNLQIVNAELQAKIDSIHSVIV